MATTVGESPDSVESTVANLINAGLLVESKTLRISPAGREQLATLLAAERTSIDTSAIATAYDEFRRVNAAFKELVSDWQLNDGETNTHDDAEYDAAVLRRLNEVHARVVPIVAAAARMPHDTTGRAHP